MSIDNQSVADSKLSIKEFLDKDEQKDLLLSLIHI